MNIEIIESEGSPEELMSNDFFMLSQLNHSSSIILHLYQWNSPSITHGYFIHPEEHLNLNYLNAKGIKIGRRPTGGGITFHLSDFAFSILVPSHCSQYSLNTLDNYACVNHFLSRLVSRWSINEVQPELLVKEENVDKDCRAFCMAKATQYDLIVKGKKLGGAAQRRTKQGFLHQGSLSLAPLSEEFLTNALKSEKIIQSMQSESCYLLEHDDEHEIEETRSALRNLMKEMISSI
ncbi:MAG: hypothetical protein Q8K60_08820 [Parachlamydiaceae bacterium]|nr:hypothetical protein [Parachlamydiaceae bacterium]